MGDTVEKYPKAIAFIIGNEFCERFNYYGIRAILVLYLTRKLNYTENESTMVFHIFAMTAYAVPMIGAIIADSWLGRFKTILYLSVVYLFGCLIIAAGAIPTIDVNPKYATIFGLALIAIGTGGIKPNVSAFGGDQFKVPEQTKQLVMFFSFFYFSINAGSLISTTITPILREDVHCFGDQDCYSLAFSVPAMLMVLAVVIFVAGTPLYIIKRPTGNMILGVGRCVFQAIDGWCRERSKNPRKHWLDYAESKSSQQMVQDTKALFRILYLFIPLPFFWALFEQQASRWTLQATRMDGYIFGVTIKPDQMHVTNPFLILVLIPVFNYFVYPALEKAGIKRPLQKLVIGGFLAAGAFFLSGLLELRLEYLDPRLPGPNECQLRIYNGMTCDYTVTSDLPNQGLIQVTSMGLWENKDLIVSENLAHAFTATAAGCPQIAGTFNLMPGKAVSYFFKANEAVEFIDDPQKPSKADPTLRVLLNVPNADSQFTLKYSDITKDVPNDVSTTMTILRGPTTLISGDSAVATFTTYLGGTYALIVQGDKANGFTTHLLIITEPNSVHMLWQILPYFVMTAGEVMFSVTGLEFSFTQAPKTIKSVLQACWLLTVAFGNFCVVIITAINPFTKQSHEFFFFAVLMCFDMFIFILLAMRYKYAEGTYESGG